jgi:hypothetical protein
VFTHRALAAAAVLALASLLAACGSGEKQKAVDHRLRDAMSTCNAEHQGAGGDISLEDGEHTIVMRDLDGETTANLAGCVLHELHVSSALASEITNGEPGKANEHGLKFVWASYARSITITDGS